jgi:hypothetical protein
LDKGGPVQKRSEAADCDPTSGHRLLVTPDRATAGRSAVARSGGGVFFFKNWELIFFYFLKALACCKGLGCFGGCVHSTPIF